MLESVQAQNNNFDPAAFLPSSFDGWTPMRADRNFSGEELYDYIDGGAELFLSFGFKTVYNRIYAAEDQPDIFVDIFEMNTSFDSYGVFTQSREKNENQFGQESEYTEGAVLFWKDNYYVSIISSIETKESNTAIFKLAQIIDSAIPKTGFKPDIVKLLPVENLIPESIKYFRHHHWQNAYQFISFENIFDIDQNTHAMLAKYKFKADTPLLLLIKYPDHGVAEKAYNQFIAEQSLKVSSGGIAIDKNDKLIGIKIDDNILSAVFNAASEETAMKLLKSIHK